MDRLAVMEAYVRIVEMGSFSAAAKHLNIGQSAVSKCVAQLEDRLGVCLLMRSTHGLKPTEAGRTYFERARSMIEQAEETDRAVRGADAGLAGRLRVNAGTTFGKLNLVSHLPAFLRAHPELSIDLVLEDRAIDLIGEGIDMALRFGPLSDCSLVGRKIAATRRLIVGASQYFDRAGVPQTPNDLVGHHAVIYTRELNGGGSWVFRQGGTEIEVNLPDRLRVSASEGVRAAVLGEMGIAVASRWMFESELASGAVRAVLTEWTLPEIELWVVYPTGRAPNAKARAFTAFVEATVRERNFGKE